jgi:hypothetical protein
MVYTIVVRHGSVGTREDAGGLDVATVIKCQRGQIGGISRTRLPDGKGEGQAESQNGSDPYSHSFSLRLTCGWSAKIWPLRGIYTRCL